MGHAKYRLEGTDGTLHGNPLEIEPAPEVRIAEDTRIKALVGVWIDVDAPPIEGGGARQVTPLGDLMRWAFGQINLKRIERFLPRQTL